MSEWKTAGTPQIASWKQGIMQNLCNPLTGQTNHHPQLRHEQTEIQ